MLTKPVIACFDVLVQLYPGMSVLTGLRVLHNFVELAWS